jgi:hypothetical protein
MTLKRSHYILVIFLLVTLFSTYAQEENTNWLSELIVVRAHSQKISTNFDVVDNMVYVSAEGYLTCWLSLQFVVDELEIQLVPGDIETDGIINDADSYIVANSIANKLYEPRADINRDGQVNIADLSIVGSNYGLSSSECFVISTVANILTPTFGSITATVSALNLTETVDSVANTITVTSDGTALTLAVNETPTSTMAQTPNGSEAPFLTITPDNLFTPTSIRSVETNPETLTHSSITSTENPNIGDDLATGSALIVITTDSDGKTVVTTPTLISTERNISLTSTDQPVASLTPLSNLPTSSMISSTHTETPKPIATVIPTIPSTPTLLPTITATSTAIPTITPVPTATPTPFSTNMPTQILPQTSPQPTDSPT